MEHKNCRLFMITGSHSANEKRSVVSYEPQLGYFKIHLFARFLACAFYFWVNFCPFVGLNVDSLL